MGSAVGVHGAPLTWWWAPWNPLSLPPSHWEGTTPPIARARSATPRVPDGRRGDGHGPRRPPGPARPGRGRRNGSFDASGLLSGGRRPAPMAGRDLPGEEWHFSADLGAVSARSGPNAGAGSSVHSGKSPPRLQDGALAAGFLDNRSPPGEWHAGPPPWRLPLLGGHRWTLSQTIADVDSQTR